MMQQVAVYGLTVEGNGEYADPFEADEYSNTACIQITMAAIDGAALADLKEPVTLKMVRRIDLLESDDDDEEEEELDSETDSEINDESAEDEIEEEEDDDDEEEEGESEEAEDDENSELDSDDADAEEEEYVLCTLMPPMFQVPLQLTIYPDEPVFFRVSSKSGEVPVHLTGNYVLPDNAESEEEDSDVEYDSDDLDDETLRQLLTEEEEEEDSAEDADENKIEEIGEEANVARKRIPIEGSDEGEEKKLSKNQMRKLKKQKANSGEAIGTKTESPKAKTVSFEDENEPPQLVEAEKIEKKERKTLSGGLAYTDNKVGKGPEIKNGSQVGIRYIGKLAKNKKQFDANTKGKPFTFTVGRGQVIAGLEKGIVGLRLGGERKIEIPAAMGYGKKGAPPSIPANADLIFDVRVVQVK